MMSTLTQWNIAKDLARGLPTIAIHAKQRTIYVQTYTMIRETSEIKRHEIFRLHEARWYENRSEL